MADLSMFLTTNILFFIKQWLLLNPITSLYRLFTETNALLEKTYDPENTLHLTGEMFSINFVTTFIALPSNLRTRRDLINWNWKTANIQWEANHFFNFCKLTMILPWSLCAPSWETYQKSLSFCSGNCCLCRKIWSRKSISLQPQPLSGMPPLRKITIAFICWLLGIAFQCLLEYY